MEAGRAMLMNFLILQDVRSLFGCARYFACFNKLLPVKRLKVILSMKKDKTSPLKHFLFLRYSKKQTAQRNRVPSPIHDQSKNYQEKCCFYKIFTCNIQIMIYFLKKYQHPAPYSSLFSMLVRMYLIVNDFSFQLLNMT